MMVVTFILAGGVSGMMGEVGACKGVGCVMGMVRGGPHVTDLSGVDVFETDKVVSGSGVSGSVLSIVLWVGQGRMGPVRLGLEVVAYVGVGEGMLWV